MNLVKNWMSKSCLEGGRKSSMEGVSAMRLQCVCFSECGPRESHGLCRALFVVGITSYFVSPR